MISGGKRNRDPARNVPPPSSRSLSRPASVTQTSNAAAPASPSLSPSPSASTSKRQTRAQTRAKVAWEWVGQAKGKLRDRDRYKTLAQKLSSNLQVSGFAQTMAFLYSKADLKAPEQDPAGMLFLQLGARVLEVVAENWRPGARADEIMEAIVELSADQSREAGQEALLMSEWLRRFAPSV